MTDKANPAHYDGDACMRKISTVTGAMPGAIAFCIGQAIKYLWRTDRKTGEPASDDERKALWYLDWIERAGSPRTLNDLERSVIDDLRYIASYTVPEERCQKVQDL